MIAYFSNLDTSKGKKSPTELFVGIPGLDVSYAALDSCGNVISVYKKIVSEVLEREGVGLVEFWLSKVFSFRFQASISFGCSSGSFYPLKTLMERRTREKKELKESEFIVRHFFLKISQKDISRFVMGDGCPVQDKDSSLGGDASFYACAKSLWPDLVLIDSLSGKSYFDMRQRETADESVVKALLLAECTRRKSAFARHENFFEGKNRRGGTLEMKYNSFLDPDYKKRKSLEWREKHKGDFPYEGFDLAKVSHVEWQLYRESGYTRHPLPDEVLDKLNRNETGIGTIHFKEPMFR